MGQLRGLNHSLIALGLMSVFVVFESQADQIAYTYDSEGRVASHTDWKGVTTTYQYNERGLEIGRTEMLNTLQSRTITTEWDSDFRLPITVSEPGKVTTHTYSTSGLELSRTMTDTATQNSRTWHYTYNDLGLKVSEDGPRTDVNDITTFTYDTKGNLSLITNALGHDTRITAYDAAGRPITIVDPNGLSTQLSYDPRGRLISQAVSDGSTTHNTTYTYDPVGNLTDINLPDGTTIGYVYDAANRLIGLRDSLGNHIDYTLDAMGNRTSEQVVDTNGVLLHTSRRVYDELGRMLQLIDAHEHIISYQYDANGNLTLKTDARLNYIAHFYDAFDRIKQTTDALEGITSYTYDSQGNLTSVTDPKGLTTTYTYDGLGNRLSLSSPDTGLTTYTYDEAGNQLSQTDSRDIKVTYTYDALNRLTSIQYPAPSLAVRYGYDQGVNSIGLLTSMTDAQGTTDYGYDVFGRLISEIRSDDTLTTAFHYSYDSVGRLASLTYPSGHKLLYSYDNLGQVSDVTLQKPDASLQPLATNIQRLPFGPIQSFDYGNDLILNREFDQNYRLIAQAVPGILNNRHQHDSVGNLIDWSDLLDTSRDQIFGYDALDRLISATGLYGDLSISYDATGNRLNFTHDLVTDTYHYAADSHRLLEILGNHPENRTYDAVGNTLQSALGNYVYDATNRPIRNTRAGVVAEYSYNGKGERIRKTVNGQTINFRYGPDSKLLGEYDGDGNPLREYIYLEGQPLAELSFNVATTATTLQSDPRCVPRKARNKHERHWRTTIGGSDSKHRKKNIYTSDTTPYGSRGCGVTNSELIKGEMKQCGHRTAVAQRECHDKRERKRDMDIPQSIMRDTTSLAYLHTDHLGAVVKATDENQNLIWDVVRRPFGNRSLITAQIEMPLGFPGQYYDEESGVFYNYFRDYDPSTGRYLQSDSIGLDGGLNTYAYGGGNPLSHIDPTGLDWLYDGGTNTFQHTDSNGNITNTWPAVSGPWGNGQLPPGSYTLPSPPVHVPPSHPNQASYCDSAGNCWWQPITPNFPTNRGGLGIHPDGNVPGTAGCVGATDSDTTSLFDALSKDQGPLIVR